METTDRERRDIGTVLENPVRSDLRSGPDPVEVDIEKPLEAPEYALNSIDDLAEAVEDGVCVTGINDSPFKRYAEGNVALHFHLWLWSAARDTDFGNYCVVLESALTNHGTTGATINGDFDRFGVGLGRGEQLVFVSGIQFLKLPERRRIRLRSRTWLQNSEFCNGIRMNPLQSLAPAPELLATIVDGEQGLPIGEVAKSQSPSEIVERAASVVDAIPDDQCPARQRHRLSDLQLEQVSGVWTVIFDDHSIGLQIQESTCFHVERLEMFLGATQFLPTFP